MINELFSVRRFPRLRDFLTFAFIIYCSWNCKPTVSLPASYRNDATILFPPGSIILSQYTFKGFSDSKGILSLWRLERDKLSKIWSIDAPCYRDILAEDIDDDGKKEIVALGNLFLSQNKKIYGIEIKNKYFVDIYKENAHTSQNIHIPWISTFQDSERNNIIDEEDGEAKGMFITDIDGDGMKEIIFPTLHHIGIFKYINNNIRAAPYGRLVKTATLQPTLPKERIRINAISIIKEQEESKIIVSVNVEVIENHVEMGMHYSIKNILSRGYVLMYQFSKKNGKWMLLNLFPVDIDVIGTFAGAYLDNTDIPDICIVGNIKRENGDNHFLYIFNKSTSIWRFSKYPLGPFSLEPICLGVGNFNSINGFNEIVTVKPGIMQIDIYDWTKESGLVRRLSKNVANESAFSSSLKIAITDIDHDGNNEIILAGFGKSELEAGDLYLSIYNQNLELKGNIIGGGQIEKPARAIAIIN